MDIQSNKDIYSGLKGYIQSLGEDNYGNDVLELAPLKPIYPFTLIHTIRDVAVPNYNSCYGRVSSKGYSIDIYAQDKGKISRKDIAEQISVQVDDFMTNYVGLDRASYNDNDLEKEGTVFHITITYSGNLDEYRRKFI